MSGNRSRPTRQRPLPRGQAMYTPGASARRRSLEQASARPLVFLHQLPAWLPPVVVAVALIVGLAVRGLGGAVALCLMAVALAWLAFVSWPGLSGQGRLVRVAVVACALALAGWQATR